MLMRISHMTIFLQEKPRLGHVDAIIEITPREMRTSRVSANNSRCHLIKQIKFLSSESLPELLALLREAINCLSLLTHFMSF